MSATTTLRLLLCCMAAIFGCGTAVRDMPENVERPQQVMFNRYGTHMSENVQPQQPEMLNPQGTHMPETVQPGNHFPVDLPENVQEKQPEMYPYYPHYPYYPRRYPPYYYMPPHFPRKCVSAVYEVRECVEDIIKSLRAGKYGPSKVCCKVATGMKDACPHSAKNKFLHAAMLHHCPKKHSKRLPHA